MIKNKILRLTFLFLGGLLLCTCKKEENYTIEGHVQNSVTGLPVSGAVISISSSNVNQFVYNTGFITLGSASADQSGNFKITIPIEKAAEYKLSSSKNNYFIYESSFTQDKIIDNKYFAEISLVPEALLRIVAKNTNPYSLSDKIMFWYEGDNKACYDCCTNNKYNYTGPDINDSITCKTIGGKYAVVNYVVEKNGEITVHRDSIMCLSDKVNIIRINY